MIINSELMNLVETSSKYITYYPCITLTPFEENIRLYCFSIASSETIVLKYQKRDWKNIEIFSYRILQK